MKEYINYRLIQSNHSKSLFIFLAKYSGVIHWIGTTIHENNQYFCLVQERLGPTLKEILKKMKWSFSL